MSFDETESDRRELQATINSQEAGRAALEQQHGRVWNTQELRDEFSVEGFMAPFVLVTRKADRKQGTLMFQHDPRFYFAWQET